MKKIYLNKEAFEKLIKCLGNPPEPNEALINLLRGQTNQSGRTSSENLPSGEPDVTAGETASIEENEQ